jgi:hypothetical protein
MQDTWIKVYKPEITTKPFGDSGKLFVTQLESPDPDFILRLEGDIIECIGKTVDGSSIVPLTTTDELLLDNYNLKYVKIPPIYRNDTKTAVKRFAQSPDLYCTDFVDRESIGQFVVRLENGIVTCIGQSNDNKTIQPLDDVSQRSVTSYGWKMETIDGQIPQKLDFVPMIPTETQKEQISVEIGNNIRMVDLYPFLGAPKSKSWYRTDFKIGEHHNTYIIDKSGGFSICIGKTPDKFKIVPLDTDDIIRVTGYGWHLPGYKPQSVVDLRKIISVPMIVNNKHMSSSISLLDEKRAWYRPNLFYYVLINNHDWTCIGKVGQTSILLPLNGYDHQTIKGFGWKLLDELMEIYQLDDSEDADETQSDDSEEVQEISDKVEEPKQTQTSEDILCTSIMCCDGTSRVRALTLFDKQRLWYRIGYDPLLDNVAYVIEKYNSGWRCVGKTKDGVELLPLDADDKSRVQGWGWSLPLESEHNKPIMVSGKPMTSSVTTKNQNSLYQQSSEDSKTGIPLRKTIKRMGVQGSVDTEVVLFNLFDSCGYYMTQVKDSNKDLMPNQLVIREENCAVICMGETWDKKTISPLNSHVELLVNYYGWKYEPILPSDDSQPKTKLPSLPAVPQTTLQNLISKIPKHTLVSIPSTNPDIENRVIAYRKKLERKQAHADAFLEYLIKTLLDDIEAGKLHSTLTLHSNDYEDEKAISRAFESFKHHLHDNGYYYKGYVKEDVTAIPQFGKNKGVEGKYTQRLLNVYIEK